MIKASIIVPVYNAQMTIKDCIESICCQTEKEIELILVDDGSSDASYLICMEMAEKDERIKVIRKENGGVSSARNVGIEQAQGEYILFCDSDDIVEKNWVEVLLGNSSPECVCVCGYYLEEKDKQTVYGFESGRVIDGADFLDIGYGVLLGSVCNKCFYTRTLRENDLRFDETISFEEDVIFCVQYFSFCKKISLSDQALYHYNDRPGSLIHSTKSVSPMFILQVYNLIENTIRKSGGDFSKYEADHYKAVFSSLEARITDRQSAKTIIYNKQFQKAIRFADHTQYDPRYLLLLKVKAIPIILKLKHKSAR